DSIFYQAGAGRRCLHVTGVQTCALPICATRMREPHRQICPEFWNAERTMIGSCPRQSLSANTIVGFLPPSSSETFFSIGAAMPRSEERRVGKEARFGRAPSRAERDRRVE